MSDSVLVEALRDAQRLIGVLTAGQEFTGKLDATTRAIKRSIDAALASSPAMTTDPEMEKRLTALRAASTYLFTEGNQKRDKDKIAWAMALDHIADFITERLTPPK